MTVSSALDVGEVLIRAAVKVSHMEVAVAGASPVLDSVVDDADCSRVAGPSIRYSCIPHLHIIKQNKSDR